LVKGEKVIIDEDDLITGYENAFDSERTYLEKMWEEMSSAPAQLSLLMEIVKGSNKLYSLENESRINVFRSINMLIKKGIIRKKEKGKYVIIDPFFEEYLLRSE
jgi:hypothetical protein